MRRCLLRGALPHQVVIHPNGFDVLESEAVVEVAGGVVVLDVDGDPFAGAPRLIDHFLKQLPPEWQIDEAHAEGTTS